MTDFHTTTQNLTQSCGTEKGKAAGLQFLLTLKHLLCTQRANGGGWLVWFASHLHFLLSAGMLHCVFVFVKCFQIPPHYSQSENLNNCLNVFSTINPLPISPHCYGLLSRSARAMIRICVINAKCLYATWRQEALRKCHMGTNISKKEGNFIREWLRTG